MTAVTRYAEAAACVLAGIRLPQPKVRPPDISCAWRNFAAESGDALDAGEQGDKGEYGDAHVWTW